jgi:hypothetical protein
MASADTHEEDPGLDGPDYVALVIEWDEDEDEATIVRELRPVSPVSSFTRTIVGVVGALLALGLATWGLRRLHAS